LGKLAILPGMTPARLTRRSFLAVAGAGAAAVPVAACAGASNRLEVTRPVSPGRSPAPGKALRVVLVADTHAPHYWFDPGALEAAVTAFDPHLLLIVGDAVDRRGNEPLVSMYGRLPARIGKYATLGNWEHQARCDLGLLRRAYDRAGVRLLVNERIRLDAGGGEGLDLVGLDDWRAGRPDWSLVAEGMLPAASDVLRGNPFPHSASTPPGIRTIVMAHCPIAFDLVAALRRTPFTMLSGHTHGGQIAPLGVALYRPVGSGRYLQGWYGWPGADHRMYVSQGLGNSGIPFRIGARPELALLTL
jgi:predicted MPP superfamily phosphohydrolase